MTNENDAEAKSPPVDNATQDTNAGGHDAPTLESAAAEKVDDNNDEVVPAKEHGDGATMESKKEDENVAEGCNTVEQDEINPDGNTGQQEAGGESRPSDDSENKVDEGTDSSQNAVAQDGEKDGSAQEEIHDKEGSNYEQDSDHIGAAMDDATHTDPTNIANSKGAKLLINRFSTWRQKTNENAQSLWKQGPAIQENAKALWKQGPNIAISRLSAIRGTAKEGVQEKQDEGIDSTDEPVSKPTETEPESHSENLEKVESDEDSEEAKVDMPGGDGAADQRDTRARVGVAVSKAAAAASVVAESVATNFRGRYSGKAPPPVEIPEPSTPAKVSPESQTSLILKSRVAKHMQDMIDGLDDHEFVMLLGNGMLGVNLKQCYLKNHGVFVDFLVPGGQSELSGVVRTGDLLVKVGDVDIRKGTIAEIPQTIAGVKRPVVLILATGTKVPIERMNYVDIAVAMMHRMRKLIKEKGGFDNFQRATLGDTSQDGKELEEEKSNFNETDGVENSTPGDDTQGKKANSLEEGFAISVSNVSIPVEATVDIFVTPPAPTLPVRKEFLAEVAQRCNEKFDLSDLCQAAEMDNNFRAAIRNAFLACAIDSRKLPYLARHLAAEDDVSGDGDIEGKITPSAKLMLFLELTSFFDLYGVTPVSRLRDVAKRIAHKFFLPNQVGKFLQPPLFDFHKIVPDSSLRHLELVLGGNSRSIPCDVFLDFQNAVVESLMGAPFLSFLTSAECSRMRAFLRDTAPYVNLPLRELFDALVGQIEHAGAKNCFAYMLLYLICQQERQPLGEHDFTTGENNRLLGAASGITCAVYIHRIIVPTIAQATDSGCNPECSQKLIQVFARFWDIFISPGVGALENFSKSNELEASYNVVRDLLESANGDSFQSDKDDGTPKKTLVDSLLDAKLVEATKHLADELLYDYAARVHTKFREHKFHEWMCNEFCKMKVGDRTWSTKQELPLLPQGCIKRLLRKAELPEGVSSHKPFKASAPKVAESKQSTTNAEHIILFGSAVGNDLAAQMPIPTIEKSDIRRYRCISVHSSSEEEGDTIPDDPVPATFESYALVPPSKPKPFADAAGELRKGVDGWEVSLVNFIIPNGDSSSGDSTESALFGVSLVFHTARNDKESLTESPMKTELVSEPSPADSKDLHVPEKKTEEPEEVAVNGNFVSPISFVTSPSNAEATEAVRTETMRKIKVSAPTPVLNEKLQGKSWVDRAAEDEYRDHETPLTLGLALVSRKNVIIAMRETLSRLLHDFSRTPTNDSKNMRSKLTCGALVEILGAFSHHGVEDAGLRCILEPYLKAASVPWLANPGLDQKAEFEKQALKQLTYCLPPTPLALMFATALLEQKLVLSSSRRSILHSASVALATMLRPLKWSHLLVPLAPSALANDLIQYPAPFILGVPSEEPGSIDLINNLPTDVTLVDLDVGRVILAPSFGQDNEMVRGTPNAEVTAMALRSQVLYLAQSLGAVFGNSLQKTTWSCDSPSFTGLPSKSNAEATAGCSGIDNLMAVTRRFIAELLEGATSCCYWLEEASQSFGSSDEPTVLFDEDRFFHIKNLRATKGVKPLFGMEKTADLALSLDDFDLVLESFLRCQSMSSYISSCPKTEMMYY